MSLNKNLFFRKSHRYLGLFIGIQFLAWTISGLYFSWNDIDSVHGDDLRKAPHYIPAATRFVSPDSALQQLRSKVTVDSIESIHLISILGKPFYQLVYFSGHAGDGMHLHTHLALADATTGGLRGPLTKDEAISIAKDHVVASAKMMEVVLLKDTDAHHEYRERPLPAYAVSFADPNCTVYVSTERGTFQTVRHSQWRAFDFL